MVFGPGKARHDDCGLAIFEGAGFTTTEADQAATAVFTFVLGNALGPAAADTFVKKLSRDGGDAEALLREHMAQAREIAAQYPRLRARLDGPSAEYAGAPVKTFEFGLHAILDGLEARLAGARQI
jgi:hypothetical protein